MINPLHFRNSVGSIEAFFTERGTAEVLNPYSEYNCCDYVGDESPHVASCRAFLCKAIGVEQSHLVTARQTHSLNVAVIDRLPAKPLYDIDALVTRCNGIVLGVYTADCVPVVLCDANEGVIAVAHAGWKGTMGGIVSKTIDSMVNIGAKVENINVAFGPSICQYCFEVGDEVVELFKQSGFPIEEIAVFNDTTSKYHIDLVETNALIMAQCGIAKVNIMRSGLCTKCNPRRFFSARNLGINSGRIFTGIIRR